MPRVDRYLFSVQTKRDEPAASTASVRMLFPNGVDLSVDYDPVKKTVNVRQVSGQPVLIMPEANNSFHLKKG